MAQLVKTEDGLAIASCKTVAGLAIASIKTIDGLDNTASASLVIANAWKHATAGTSDANPVSPSAGSLLVLVGYTYGGVGASALTITDNIGSGVWSVVTTKDVATGLHIGMWYQKNCPAGITTITVSNGATEVQSIIHEVTGASASAPFTAGEFSTPGTGTSTNPQTGTVTYATNNTILFAAMTNLDSGNPATATVNSTGSTGGTWSLFSTNSRELNGGGIGVLSVPSLIVAASGSAVHGWATSNFQWATISAAFHT